mgnify:CR=1 FL=1
MMRTNNSARARVTRLGHTCSGAKEAVASSARRTVRAGLTGWGRLGLRMGGEDGSEGTGLQTQREGEKGKDDYGHALTASHGKLRTGSRGKARDMRNVCSALRHIAAPQDRGNIPQLCFSRRSDALFTIC